MLNVFENCWLLLTLAGAALLAAGFLRQEKPDWGLKPMLVPLLLAGLGFGLDASVRTDHEWIAHIIKTSKQAAVEQDVDTIIGFISPNYTDSSHRTKPELATAAKGILKKASINKIRVSSHLITIEGTTAKSELKMSVHLNPNSEYPMAGSLVFVEMAFEYEKIGTEWFILRAEITSVNYQPMQWDAIG